MVYQCRVLIHNKIILFMIPDFLVTLYIRNSTLPTISPKSPSCLALVAERACWDFLGGLMVMSPPSNAGDAGLVPGHRTKVLHAAGQLSLHATTREKLVCYN